MNIKILQNLQKYNYTFQEVKNGLFKQDDLASYFVETLIFCQNWLNGQEIFELQTSGSTGKPKKITIQRFQMQASARATIKKLDLSQNLKALVCINTNYIGGKMMLVRGLETNWEVVIVEPTRNPLETSWTHFEEETFDFTALVPLQLQTMLDSENEKVFSILDKMQAIIVGGAKVSESLKAKSKALKNVRIYSTYGMTETVSHIALQKVNTEIKEDYFELLPDVEVDVNNKNCLQIKATVTQNKWIQTNDLVEILDTKRFKLLGRIDNVMNSGGVKVQAEKVEQAVEKVLIELEADIRFFVAGLPNEELGEQITLFLETNSIEEKPFLLKLKNYLSPYELPKKIACIASFLETESGKIDKKAILKDLDTGIISEK